MAMFKFKAPAKKKKRKLAPASIRDDESSADEVDEGLKKKQLVNHSNDADDIDHDADVEDHGLSRTEKPKQSTKKEFKKLKKRKKRNVSTAVSNGAVSFTHEDGEMEDEDEHMLAGKDTKSKKKDKKKKKKSKLNRTTKGGLGFGGANVLSHLDDGDDDDDEDENMSKKGIKRSRFGMGKLEQSIIHDDDDDGDTQQIEKDGDSKIEAGISSSSFYGKDALEKLKAEQKKMKQPSTDESHQDQASNKAKEENDSNSHRATDSTNVPLPPKPKSMQKPKPPPVQQNDMDNDFIPLDSSNILNETSSHFNIVAGDEALLYAGELDGGDDDGINKANLGTETLSNIPTNQNTTTSHDVLAGINGNKDIGKNDDDQDIERDEGGRKWEEEIARRAGVTPKNEQRSTTDRQSNVTTTSSAQPTLSKESGSKVIKDVKSTIRSTLHNLTQMDLDLESNIGRRGHDEEMSNEDATKKEKELEDIGKKFEYYQNLRVKLADWIGALRYMSERVSMVENAINNLNYEFATKDEKVWKEWEDDVIANLKDRGLLDYIVGRQPEVNDNGGDDVDEFGRDRRSLQSLARTKRESTRRRVRAESKDRRRTEDLSNACHPQTEFDDSDLDLSDNELMDREERRCAVSDAIGVVVDEMDDEYSTPSKLITAFENWQNLYREDFDQCYAKLAFVDLMNVFVRCESCQKVDLLRMAKKAETIKTDFYDYSWFIALQQFQKSQEKTIKDKDHKQNVFVKTNQIVSKLYETILSVFKHPDSGFGCYNPFSTKQTKSLVSFFETIKSHVDENENRTLLEDISKSILQHINNFVQNQAIPIIKQSQQRGQQDESTIFAVTGQLHRLKKILINLLDWYDALNGEAKVDIGKFCLMDLIGYRILPILNSMEGGFVNDLDPKLFLKEVKQLIQTKQMLDNENFYLSSAPLRAALSKLDQD